MAALLLVAVAWVAFQRYVRAPQPAVPEVPVAQAPLDAGAVASPVEPHATITKVSGPVERRKEDGAWAQVGVGDRLLQRERLRAGPGGEAQVALDDRSLLDVSERTEVGVEELSDAVQRLKLVKGRVSAQFEPTGERVLQIEDEKGRRAVVKKAAAFSVLGTGDGLSVATRKGAVDLEAAGKAVTVGEGQQAVAAGTLAPNAPVPISREVLLIAAAAARKGGACSEVRGTVAPGSEVTVEGVEAQVDAHGRFVATLPDGARRTVRVVTREPSGRVDSRTVPCQARTRTQGVDVDIQRWHKKPR